LQNKTTGTTGKGELLKELKEKKKAILEAMDHAVPEEHRAEAEDVLDIYREDLIGLTLLLELYTHHPESRDEWVREIRLVNRQQGVFLLVAITVQGEYLYLVSSEGLEFQGRLADGFLADELIDFFGYDSAESFKKICTKVDVFPVYEPLQLDEDICPACHAATGEVHELGCPVEICPWCGGQLIHCDCRYEKLGLDSIDSEEDLVQFEVLLEERGRIPYSSEQRPSFADDGIDIVFD
jgi:hypothetical protein